MTFRGEQRVSSAVCFFLTHPKETVRDGTSNARKLTTSTNANGKNVGNSPSFNPPDDPAITPSPYFCESGEPKAQNDGVEMAKPAENAVRT